MKAIVVRPGVQIVETERDYTNDRIVAMRWLAQSTRDKAKRAFATRWLEEHVDEHVEYTRMWLGHDRVDEVTESLSDEVTRSLAHSCPGCDRCCGDEPGDCVTESLCDECRALELTECRHPECVLRHVRSDSVAWLSEN
jgi:hypothetical protein